MTYFVDLFSPETYEAFSNSSRDISGFRFQQQGAARRVEVGDKFVCYLTKLSRWVGILEVVSESFEDTTPIFYPMNDPFVIRFHVRPLIWLEKEKAIPIRDASVWNTLSFTRDQDITSSHWTGTVRGSLRILDNIDGAYLEQVISAQQYDGANYPLSKQDYERFSGHKVRRDDKEITVSVPENANIEPVIETPAEARESIKIQALLASIGAKMGLRIWIPRNDRVRVLSEWKGEKDAILEVLPLNYDQATLKTIEQIDILWLKGRAIVRAFEVEHTTAIYSGILRMADLLALQPNMDIKLHIVAPLARKDKVFQELQRPVFSLLEKAPLYELCTYISYDSVRELAQQRHLAHLSDSVWDDYVEFADEGE